MTKRRYFFPQLLGLFVSGLSMRSQATVQNERILSFYNLHTGEKDSIIYRSNDTYPHDSLSRINTLLRDHRADESHPIDTRLLDFLYELKTAVNNDSPFHVISGYRSPNTNNSLRQKSRGVAKKSLHMQGKAIDIRLPGTELATLRDTAIALRRGGVGYYAKSNFIHIDTGRVRRW